MNTFVLLANALTVAGGRRIALRTAIASPAALAACAAPRALLRLALRSARRREHERRGPFARKLLRRLHLCLLLRHALFVPGLHAICAASQVLLKCCMLLVESLLALLRTSLALLLEALLVPRSQLREMLVDAINQCLPVLLVVRL